MGFCKESIVDVDLNKCTIFRSFLNYSIGFKDDDADRFGIRAFRDGEPVDLSGASCQAVFMAPNGTKIALTSYGTVSGNVAYVTLPQACYDYEGQFCLAIKLVGGGVTGTVRIVDGTVTQTGASGAVAPTAAVPTYQEILAVYAEMQEDIEDYESVVANQNDQINSLKSALGRNGYITGFNNGYYLKRNTGEYLPLSGWFATEEYYRVEDITNINLRGGNGADIAAFYDKNYTYISGVSNVGDWVRSINVPSNAVYVRFSYQTTYANDSYVTQKVDIKRLWATDDGFIGTDGSITVYQKWKHTILYYPIDSIESIAIPSTTGACAVAYYDESLAFVGYEMQDGATITAFTNRPSSAKYVRFSYNSLKNDLFFLKRGWLETAINCGIKDEYTKNKINNLEYVIDSITKEVSMAYANSGGTQASANQTYGIWFKEIEFKSISIIPNFGLSSGSYTWKRYRMASIPTESTSGVNVTEVSTGTAAYNEAVTFSDITYYDFITFTSSDRMYVMNKTSASYSGCRLGRLSSGEALIAEVSSYSMGGSFTLIKLAPISAATALEGKKVVGIGDSMMRGHSLSIDQTWISLMCAESNAVCLNLGYNGSRICAHEYGQNTGWCNEYTQVPTDADYVLIECGTNDIAFDEPEIGTVASTDKTTIWGAMNALLGGLQSRCPKAKIGFISPYVRSESVRATVKTYVAAIKEACEYYGVPFFDNTTDGGINFTNAEIVSALTLGDGFHLNADGMEWVVPKFKAFTEGL